MTVVSSVERSAALMRARLPAVLGLGAGVVLSLITLCCGIGALMAPWILCELLAVQLGEALAEPIERSRSWFGAGAMLLGAVLLVGAVGWVTWLALMMDPVSMAGTIHEGDAGWLRLGSGGAWLAAVSSVLYWLLVLPFLYAPLILISARSGVVRAVLESARLVVRGGAIAQLGLACAANVLQLLPLLLAAALATLLVGTDRSALWMLFALPTTAVSLPLGQGMIVASYAERRADLSALSRERLESRPPPLLLALWALLLVAPLWSFGLVSASLFLRPSYIAERSLQGGEVLADVPRLTRELRIYPPATALEIRVSEQSAQVTASDGGGVGKLPLRSRRPITAVRVVRVRDRYGIELTQAGQRYATWIDGAGVRQDDDLQVRLADHLPKSGLLAMLGALLAIAVALLRVLGALGELQRAYVLPAETRPSADELAARRRRTVRWAALVGAGLVPFAALSLYWGARSLLG